MNQETKNYETIHKLNTKLTKERNQAENNLKDALAQIKLDALVIDRERNNFKELSDKYEELYNQNTINRSVRDHYKKEMDNNEIFYTILRFFAILMTFSTVVLTVQHQKVTKENRQLKYELSTKK